MGGSRRTTGILAAICRATSRTSARFDALSHLEHVLSEPVEAEERVRRFVRTFIRPMGRSQRVDRLMVREVEQLAMARKRPRRVAPPWQYPVQLALRLVPGVR